MKSINKLITGALLSVFSFAVANFALAGTISDTVNSFGGQVYGGSYTPPQQIAALIIHSVLTLLGIIFVALIMYGGFSIMTGQKEGKDKNINQGKNIIIYATIGLLIIIAAYSITTFVVTNLTNSAGGGVYGGSSSTTTTSGGTP